MLERSMNHARVSSMTLVIRTLPTLVGFVALLFTFGFLVLMLSVLTGFQAGNMLLHPNPFATYEALWPGQPITSIIGYFRQNPEGHLHCIFDESPSESYFILDALSIAAAVTAYEHRPIYCQQFPNSGVFRAITVNVETDRVQALQLISTVLQPDALYLYWGAPDAITRSNHSLYLRWDRSTYSAVAWVNELTSVVQRVALTAID